MKLVDYIRQDVANTINNWLGGREGGYEHKEILKIYNGYTPLPRGYKLKSNDAWCAATVSAAWIKTGVANICPIECSCIKLIDIAKAKKIWVEDDKYTPNIGDAVLYDWDDKSNYANYDNKNTPDHVGVVTKVDGKNFFVTEGNKSHVVGVRIMKVNGRYIRGFITPDYNKLVKVVNEIIDGKWGNGEERRNKLINAGYNYSYVQKLVNKQIIACNNVAHEVIDGLWGNGAERKKKLEAAGYPYKFVQSLVNAYLSGK